MLDLTIFQNRLFAAATAAAFINGLSRFALLFVFVFYFQGAQGDDPITAGIKLAPMAIGMLISSPLAGIWADRHGSRALAALGMVVSAVAPGGDDDAAGRQPLLAEHAVAASSSASAPGMFNSPNTAAMMGTVPGRPARDRRRRADDAAEHRRGDLDRVRARDRHRRRAQGRAASRSSPASPRASRSAKLEPFIHNMHTALWVLAATSLVGACVSLLRPRHSRAESPERPRARRSATRARRMSATG